jgi:probable F420-dependent oxidoreductase
VPARRFRFALTIGDSRDRRSFTDTVYRAEDAGFDVLAGVDHIGPPLGVMPMLAVAAEISALRVSSMVIANDYQHPVLLAKDAATIDALSEGRFELGIGTGWIKAQYVSAGIPYDRPGVRVDRLEEAITVIKGCWCDQDFKFKGEHYQVDLVESLPMPMQEPHPPLLIAGAGPRMLRLAGREADIVGITLTYGHTGFDTFVPAIATSGDRIVDQLSWIREGAGDRFSAIELSVMVHHLIGASDANHAAQTVADSSGATKGQVLDSPHILVGPPERMVDTLVERRERLGLSYVVFRGAQFEDVAPVVNRLAGT